MKLFSSLKKVVLALFILGAFTTNVFAASRYWVGGGSSTNWNATGPTNWSATSGGANNVSVPGSADDVFFDANSGTGTASMSASITIKSLDCTGYTGTIGRPVSSTTLTVVGSLTFVSGMTYTTNNINKAIAITGTGNVTTAGKSVGNFTINGSGITVTLQDSLTLWSSLATLTLTQGTLNTNGQSVTVGKFSSSNSNTRTLTLGASTVTVSGGASAWNCTTSTNLTLNANTSTITMSGTSPTFAGGGKTYNVLQFTGATAPAIFDSNTFATLTRTGTAAKTDSFDFSADQTVTGTLNLNGNSAINRVLVRSDTMGTARTLTITGASVLASNADFRDIALSVATDLSAISGGSGNCAGNSGITFTTAQTNYWVGNGGNWSDAANHWANSSGGTAGTGRVPLPQDTARFDANSFSLASQTATQDMTRFGTVDWTGVTNTPAWTKSVATGIYGSMTLVSAMTNSGTSVYAFNCRDSQTWTSNTQSLSNQLWLYMVGGTLTCQDNFVAGNIVTIYNGTFNANNFNVTMYSFASSGTATRTVTMGSGTWTMTGDAVEIVPWNFSVTTGLTFNADTSTLVFQNSSNAGTCDFGGLTYNNFTTASGAGSALTIASGTAPIFNVFTVSAPSTITFPAGQTFNVSSFVANGSAGNTITLNSSVAGTAATLSDSAGTNTVHYVSIKDSTATGGATWDATDNCTNVSGNSGWIFTSASVRSETIGRGIMRGVSMGGR